MQIKSRVTYKKSISQIYRDDFHIYVSNEQKKVKLNKIEKLFIKLLFIIIIKVNSI